MSYGHLAHKRENPTKCCWVCNQAKSISNYYCVHCVSDRVLQHEWLLKYIRSDKFLEIAAADRPKLNSNQLVHDYNQVTLARRRQKIKVLQMKIVQREQQIKLSTTLYHEMNETVKQQRMNIEALRKKTEGNDTQSIKRAIDEAQKKALVCRKAQQTLRADQMILANALCDVVGLQLAVPDKGEQDEDLLLIFGDDDDSASRLFGLPWPRREDWCKYPNDYINACVGHSIHIFSVLVHYFNLDLPFYIFKRGPNLFIRPQWREVGAAEASLSIDDHNISSFIAGLGMLLYNIAYMCHRQGVRVSVEQITDAVHNMRSAVLALSDRENVARTRIPFNLDLYLVIQSVMYMYIDGGRESEDSLKSQVHDMLRRMHVCDDAIDAIEYEDENWALV